MHAFRSSCLAGLFGLAMAFLANDNLLHAQKLLASDGAAVDLFGTRVSVAGDSALVGAFFDDDNGNHSGSAYYFRNLDGNVSGVATENVKLTASDGLFGDQFGGSVSLSGDSALIGAALDDDNGLTSGSAYYYRGLDSNTSGVATENVKLTASDNEGGDLFGGSVSLSGDAALVGARGDDDDAGSAYYFRNLDANTSGVATENVKLTASDGAADDRFGFGGVSLSGDSALIGTPFDDDNGADSGSAYYFRNLDANTSGVATENVKLTASDGAADDRFSSFGVSLSGDSALIGSPLDDDNGADSGSAYYFRNLDANTSGVATENVKLTASDGAADDRFGGVSLSGDSALIGAYQHDGIGADSGSAYYFRGLNANTTGAATETLKLTASDGATGDLFGISVALSGDSALIGSAFDDDNGDASGSAYRARISNMTTLDVGNTVRYHFGIDFESRVDWIVGETTDANLLTLAAGTTAIVDELGRSIHIGANAGSDFNQLTVDGTIEAAELFIGDLSGNIGNELVMNVDGILNVDDLYLTQGNWLVIEGDYTDSHDLLAYLSGTIRSTSLFADNGLGGWELIDSSNADIWLTSSFNFGGNGYTRIGIAAVPEPGSGLLVMAVMAGLACRRSRIRQGV